MSLGASAHFLTPAQRPIQQFSYQLSPLPAPIPPLADVACPCDPPCMQDAPRPTLSHTSQTPGTSDLLSQPDVAELYVQLLCSFDPGSVLPFLQSRERYDVRRCMAYCAEAGDRCAAARAFLHERLGELEAAGRLYIAEAVR